MQLALCLVCGPEDLSPPEYFWGYNRMMTVDGLFAAGDAAGGTVMHSPLDLLLKVDYVQKQLLSTLKIKKLLELEFLIAKLKSLKKRYTNP